jgi:hypothetical protein
MPVLNRDLVQFDLLFHLPAAHLRAVGAAAYDGDLMAYADEAVERSLASALTAGWVVHCAGLRARPADKRTRTRS